MEHPVAVALEDDGGGGGGAWTTGGGGPHEQLGAVGEPMVAAAGHGRPAALGKARER